MMNARFAFRAFGIAIVAAASPARASAPSVFGHGAESAGLAAADVADPAASNAAQANAAAAASDGVRLRVGYAYGAMALSIDGASAGVRDVSGVDLAVQYGDAVGGRGLHAGVALAAHVPDGQLARIAFRPATEPQLVLYEASLARATVDTIVALRYERLAIGGGIGWSVDLAGRGTRFTLGQDANGTYADAETDVELPYRLAPIVGARVDLGRFAVGASFRGATSIDLALESANTIALTDNPLNGDTTVRVHGSSGYEPAVIAVGARARVVGGLSAFASLAYAAYSAAPAPVADVTIDVALGTTPSQREVRFVEPRFRDTLTPRLGLELASAASREEAGRWAARLGYAIAPSPVPAQTGLTSYADATRHMLAIGGGYRLGRVAGVELAIDLAGQVHVLATRAEEKAIPSLPHARFETSGHIVHAAASLEAVWR